MTQKQSVLDELPGELIMWIFIISELLVFGGGLVAFLSARIVDPVMFAESQDLLHRTGAALNTIVLVTSGFLAAQALSLRKMGERVKARLSLIVAAELGVVFLVIKGVEYADKAAQGIDIETNTFFTLYYLLTGFHALHVVAGVVILLLIAWKDDPENIETGGSFWHMVDLVWVLLFPVIYLLG